ncbi:hypothetical protein B0A54_03077 [Friedmanniomyces endolithicus]|uniref:ATP-dependent bile acid permease n=1 Tax=Friedmanniomyces endolithicus TaxID=329885 RepID=A0A4U0VBF7_9PEZI|nr:hypothetical protein B0A54_03077 [Friedmanniomyces endolithicus]
MFARPEYIWKGDDFSRAFEQDYLQTLLPLISCAFSLLYLTYQIARSFDRSRNVHPYHALQGHVAGGARLAEAAEEDGGYDEESEDEAEDEMGRNQQLALHPTPSQIHRSILKVDKPAGELVIAVLEVLAVFAEAGTQIAALILHAWGRKGTVAAAASVAVWVYIAVLASLRLLFSSSSKLRTETLASVHFGLVTLLTIIALTSRKGNRVVQLEYEGDLAPSREPLASVLSLATFSWVDSIVWRGYQKTTEMSDVWNLMPKDKAAAILADYRQLKKTSILAFHLLRYFRRGLLIQASWAVISGLVTFVPTLLLKVILQYVEDPASTPRNAAWFYVTLLFVSGLMNALANGQALWQGIMKKVMSFGRKKKADTAKTNGSTQPEAAVDDSQVTSGAIINLMAVDSFKVAEISAYLHFLWAETPVQFVLAIYLLYAFLGRSSLVGIGMMALLLPINLIIAKRFSSVQKKILAATDARINTSNEVLTNIRIIKYFAWEHRFLAIVDENRVVELKQLRNRYILWAIAATIWSGAPVLITFLTFFVYTVVEKKALIPSIAFTALSLFSLLRIPLDQLADMVAHVQEGKVSVDRVEEYLNEPETDKYNQLESDELDEDGSPVIGFDRGTFSWGGKEGDDFKMIELDMRFHIGQLNVVIGPTGSGKTSLLMALLGEMTLIDGLVYLPGGKSREDLKANPETSLTESVAYCAQQAWLLNGTIKDNIVFASRWDAKRYKEVIVACSLQRDLEILDQGDQTLVGEKGVTLSGGQKQRISLARALYCTARHVLMDDVLSAVDSHTAKWIFDKAIMGPLMYNRTCILVTHNATLCLPQAEFAVLLDNGRVSSQGTASEVIASGMLTENISKLEAMTASRNVSALPSRVPSGIAGDVPLGTDSSENGHLKVPNGSANGVPHGDPLTKVVSKDIPGMNKVVDADSQQERKAEGSVKFSIILSYLLYAALGVGFMIITLVREGVLFGGSLTASKRIHRNLMESVTHARFRFFDTTPLGQIMNRFSKDIESVDQEIAPVAVGVVHCLASIITIVVLISVITPSFLIAAVFITALYFVVGRIYISSSRDLKRLESVQRSPLYQQFGETLSGMTTIRAYGDERRFIRENLQRVNTHSRPFIYLWAANRWLAFRVDVVGALVAFFTGVFVVLSVGRIDAGTAGLAMTYAVTFTENVLWFVRLYASNEQNMNAVERIKEYLDVEQEAPPIIPENRPEANWPSKGSVEFIGYSTRYRSDFDFVLKRITFRILPGEKVGVVGRTGAGKSSLALALFRALEAEEGKILVDDVDIGLIGLQDLRENIVMVPQDPTLFTGTIRSNLDPFGLFTDEEIFTILRGVQLVGAPSATASAANTRPQTPVNPMSGSLPSTPDKKRSPAADSPNATTDAGAVLENKNIFRNLSTAVAEHGSNLSQGQRQLLCLARAPLKNPKVLLMDEATASIDYATDAKIQGTIREIKNTTITIAHRLQTIIDYDKVLVLDKGEVIEFGDPYDLINKERGIFHGMCEMSGDLEVLQRDAKKAYEAKRLVDDS